MKPLTNRSIGFRTIVESIVSKITSKDYECFPDANECKRIFLDGAPLFTKLVFQFDDWHLISEYVKEAIMSNEDVE